MPTMREQLDQSVAASLRARSWIERADRTNNVIERRQALMYAKHATEEAKAVTVAALALLDRCAGSLGTDIQEHPHLRDIDDGWVRVVPDGA